MSEAFPYADIVILALIAAFILLRLRSVLGQRNGHENPDFFRPKQNDEATPSKKPDAIIQLVEKTIKPRMAQPEQEHDPYLAKLEGTALVQTISEIKAIDPLFNVTTFLDGAKMAFEMIFDAFTKGEKQTLSMLLSEEIYNDFVRSIEEREKSDARLETTLLSVTPQEITKINLDKNIARISVSFESEQVTVERNRNGEIIGGNPSDVEHIIDEWTFERDVTSKNPNWKIIET